MSSGNGSKKVKVPYKFNTVQLNSLKAYTIKAESIAMIDYEGLSCDNNSLVKLKLYAGL